MTRTIPVIFDDQPPAEGQISALDLHDAESAVVGKAFDPNQPREPKGSDIGGQWASSGAVTIGGVEFDVRENPAFKKPKGTKPYYHDTDDKNVESILRDGLSAGLKTPEQGGLFGGNVWANSKKDFEDSDPNFYREGDAVIEFYAKPIDSSEAGYEFDEVPSEQISRVLRRHFEKAFNPNQPREPKGSPTGGQWIDEHGSEVQPKSGLQSYVDMMAKVSGVGEWYQEHGKSYTIDEDTFIGGEAQQCYKNAFLAMMNNEFGGEDSEDLTYVEGYMAVHGVPIHHAWLVTRAGKVRDYTIKEKDRDIIGGYFGVPMKWDFVKKQTLKNKVYGLTAGYDAHKTLAADPRTVVEGK